MRVCVCTCLSGCTLAECIFVSVYFFSKKTVRCTFLNAAICCLLFVCMYTMCVCYRVCLDTWCRIMASLFPLKCMVMPSGVEIRF